MTPLLVDGMFGLGDNIYQFPIVKCIAKARNHEEIYLKTSWPQIYGSISGLHFLKPDTKLRTQIKNIANYSGYDRNGHCFSWQSVKLNYVQYQHRGMALYKGLCLSSSRCIPENYFLKLRDPCLSRGRYVVIRPATIRAEWKAPSRNPRPEYIQFALDWCKARRLQTIVVADIQPPQEVYDGSRPRGADAYYEKGELGVEELMELVHKASMVVGGVGFLAPMAMALGTPAVIVHGGAGGWNGPEIINCPAVGKITHTLPIAYCRCRNHQHACNKIIDISRLQKDLEMTYEQAR